MFEKRRAILSHLMTHRLEKELQSWKNALSHNFDVAVICQSSELQRLLFDYLTNQDNLSAHIQLMETWYENTIDSSRSIKSPSDGEPTTSNLRTLYIALNQIPRGCAAVVFELQPLEALLPGPATMITMLLEAAGLDRFIDAFDAQKLSQLKRIIERGGIDDFFDAVIQVAYIVGFRGDDAQAANYLESTIVRITEASVQARNTSERASTSLENLFDQLVRLPDPHDTLKAALAHYVFHRRRVSQAEASRILKVSRSTLQSHLQLAERLKVAAYFHPQSNHA